MSKTNDDKMLKDLLCFLNEIAESNYSFKPNSDSFSGIYKDLYNSILSIRNKMRHYVFEVQVASSQVLSGSSELTVALDENTNIMQKLYNEATDIQNLNITSQQTILSSMEDMRHIADLINDVKDTSDNVKISSEQSKTVLNESLGEILEIVDSVENIKKSTDITVEYIKRLKSSTSEIKQILSTVSLIARQTHIISLNASIESARAGAAGRGFAVLTEEIRRLATQSNDAVDEIDSLISRINDEMNHLDGQMKEDFSNVGKSVECSKRVGISLNRIEQTYDDVQKMVDTIIYATEKENEFANTINKNVSDVETISRDVSEGFEQIFDAIHKQKHNTEDVLQLGECLSGASTSLSILVEKANVNLLEEYADKISNITDNIFSILQENVLADNSFLSMQKAEHKTILDNLLANYPIIEAIWSNKTNGKFIYSNPMAGIANAKVRDWFKEGVNGSQFVSEPYISAITKNPCISVSLPITDNDANIIGVLGADLKLRI